MQGKDDKQDFTFHPDELPNPKGWDEQLPISAFCLERVAGEYFISQRLLADSVKVQRISFDAHGDRMKLSPAQEVQGNVPVVLRIDGETRTADDPGLVNAFLQILRAERPFYCRTRKIRDAWCDTLRRVSVTTEMGICSGAELIPCIEKGEPDWPTPAGPVFRPN